MNARRMIVIGAALVCGLATAARSEMIIVSDINPANSAAELRWLDTVTGSTTLIGPTGVKMNDIAWVPGDAVYGVGSDGGFYRLLVLGQPLNVTKLSDLSGGQNALVSSSQGKLYAAGDATLYTINLAGVETTIGDIVSGSNYYFSSGDLAFGADPKVLYMTASGVGSSPNPIDAGSFADGFDHLIKIVLGAGGGIASVTDVGSIGFADVFGLVALDHGASLLGVTAGGEMIRVNPGTGAGSVITGVTPNLSFLGATTVPEPSSLTLGAGALAMGLGGWWARRRARG